MQAKIKWINGATFEGISGSGHRVVMDGPPEHGGNNNGIRPMEMLLLGLGGCAAFYVMHVLQKSRQPAEDCEVEIEAIRQDKAPGLITDIHVHFILTGNNLKQEHVQRAVQLSSEKYCSASLMLSAKANITHDFEIKHSPVMLA